ncbi:MAG: ferrous iron transport protein A [Spirochaetes bacterium]|nr:ferrous iron transport protein A [Spirochaetota bacterium]MBU1081893.1 ferrous iron transport protein A [Spirochaetota bacterium]
MTIAMLGEGSEFVVERVCLCRETGRRLSDMGFTNGARGLIVRRGFFGGPIQVRLGDCDLMIRVSEAAGVDVIPVDGTVMQPRGPFGRFWRGGRGGHGLGQGGHGGRGGDHGRGAHGRGAHGRRRNDEA